MENKKNFLRGALVLSIAGAISKLLGAVYRIPLASLIILPFLTKKIPFY